MDFGRCLKNLPINKNGINLTQITKINVFHLRLDYSLH